MTKDARARGARVRPSRSARRKRARWDGCWIGLARSDPSLRFSIPRRRRRAADAARVSRNSWPRHRRTACASRQAMPGQTNGRRAGPIIAPDDPSLMNMPRSRPEVLSIDDTRLPPRVEAPQLAPPSPAGPVPRDRSVTGVVRNGLTAGVAFLANRDGLADAAAAPGESIVLRAARAYEGELRTGLRALLVVGGVAGGWMTLVPLSGAVVVPGNLVVQSNVKSIQHPTGGVVAQIPVHNGMRVNAGDLLLRLDSTQAQASLQVVSKQLDEVRAKSARLVAERDGLPRPAIPPEMSSRLDDPNVKTLLASEASLFRARTTARESQKELLQEQGIAAWRGDRRPRGAGRLQGQATGTDHRRTHRRAGAVRQAAGADRAAHGPAARERQDRRRARPVDFHHRRDQDQGRRGEASDRQARSGCPHRGRQGSRRGARQGSRTQRTKRRGARRAGAHRDALADVGRDPSIDRAHHRRRDSRRRRCHGGGAGFR